MAWDFEGGALGVSNGLPLAQLVPGAGVMARQFDRIVANL